MRLLPASPRKRRRLARIGVVLLAALLVVVLSAIFKRPTDNAPTSAPAQGSVYVEDKPIKLTPAMRREINATLNRFVPAAVLRRDPMEAYELSTPALREGATRKEWERGEIPVYPASVQPPYSGWNLNYAIQGNVNFDLMLRTTKQEKEVSAISYNVDLKRMGNRWLVESFFPVAQFRRTSLENGTKVVASYDFVPLQYQGSSGTAEQGRKVFAYFLFGVPAVVLAFVLGIFGTQYVRNRRARREFLAG